METDVATEDQERTAVRASALWHFLRLDGNLQLRPAIPASYLIDPPRIVLLCLQPPPSRSQWRGSLDPLLPHAWLRLVAWPKTTPPDRSLPVVDDEPRGDHPPHSGDLNGRLLTSSSCDPSENIPDFLPSRTCRRPLADEPLPSQLLAPAVRLPTSAKPRASFRKLPTHHQAKPF